MRLLPIAKAAYQAVTDRRWRYYYRQRRIHDLNARQAMAERIASTLPPADHLPGELAQSLINDGFVPVSELLSASDVAKMRSYFATKESSDPYRPELGSFVAPEEAPNATHVAYFSNDIVIDAPGALAAANDPRILGAVSAALGGKPTISYMTAWWSLPARGQAEHAELHHRDYDDLRFVKLFLYLTDVDDESGPHLFVKGSHKVDGLMDRRRYSEEEVRAAFPAHDHLEIEGPSGTAFLENTFGLHRGIPPAIKPRLVFQVLYTLRPFIGGPAKPIRPGLELASGIRLDPYINRVYCAAE